MYRVFSTSGLSQITSCKDESANFEDSEEELTEKDKRRLDLYHKSFDDQRVDINLIIALLTHICKQEQVKGNQAFFFFENN